MTPGGTVEPRIRPGMAAINSAPYASLFDAKKSLDPGADRIGFDKPSGLPSDRSLPQLGQGALGNPFSFGSASSAPSRPAPPASAAPATRSPPPVTGNGGGNGNGNGVAAGNGPNLGSDWMVGYNSAVNTRYALDLTHTLMHSSVVCCVRFSADGRFLATGCNQTAQIFDVSTGQKVETFGTEQPPDSGTDLYIRSVAFSTDGVFLATGAEDNKIRIFKISPKSLVQTLEGHELDIYSLDFSRDGRSIASGSGDKKVIIWDLDTGKPRHILGNEEIGPHDGVTSVALSPDGRYVVAGSLDRMVRLWDARTGMFVERFEGHTDSVYSVCFSPDGQTLVSGSLDRTLKLWDLSGNRSRNRCQATFGGHKDFVLSVCFSPDGEWLISGSKDRSVQFWSPKTGVSHIMLQGHKNSVISVAHSPIVDSGILATGSGDRRARLWTYKKLST